MDRPDRLWLFDPAAVGSDAERKWEPPADGSVFREIRRGSEAPGALAEGRAWTVAHVERVLTPGGVEEYRKARRDGNRAFDLWADPHRRQHLARVVTWPVEGREATYEVFGAAGGQLALVTRRKPFARGRIRARWSVQQTGQRAAVGVKGRALWYCVWWLLFPFWVFIAFGSPDVPRTPVRTRFRLDGRRVLDWRSDGLDVLSDGWDPAVLAALVALMSSHSGRFKDDWDDAAK